MRIINHCRLNYQLRISEEYQTWFCFPEISYTPIYCKNLFQFDICGPNCLGQLSRAYVCRRNSQIRVYFSAGNAVKLSFWMGEFVRVLSLTSFWMVCLIFLRPPLTWFWNFFKSSTWRNYSLAFFPVEMKNCSIHFSCDVLSWMVVRWTQGFRILVG